MAKTESIRPLTAVVVGAGHRGLLFADYARMHPDQLQIVGVADPNEWRRNQVQAAYHFPPSHCFASAQDLAARPPLADCIINGTMDRDHVPTTLPLLRAGYQVLLEKPIGIRKDEVVELLNVARQTRRTVLVCHVLRFAPFYAEIRRRILAGAVGEVLNIQTAEHVSYHHMSVGYVRGKWNREELCGSSILMAKCCHDLDILTWMKSGVAPRQVGSFGSRMYFRPEKAPPGAGTRCLVDCPIEPQCLYSARKLYLDHPDRWSFYVWSFLEHIDRPTIEQKTESLKTNNPHGRCVWKCDNDVVDHQSVMVEFADGSTATHNLVTGTSRPCRTIHVVGTHGEIRGTMEEGRFTVLRPDPSPGREYQEETVDVSVTGDGHGGGDMRLMEDFVRVLRGQAPSISTTHLEDSIYGHLIGFEADRARAEGCIIELERL